MNRLCVDTVEVAEVGRKFASIHVFNTDKDKVSICLGVCQGDAALERQNDPRLLEIFADKNDIASFIKALKSVAVEKTLDFYLVESHGWVSVYSEQFSFETVKEYACRYFKEVDNPVLTVGYFDDDVLEIACLSAGEAVTALVKGPNIGAYGLNEADMDADAFSGLFHADAKKATEAFAREDIDEICAALARLLGIPLDLSLRDVKKDAECVTFNV